MNFEDLEIIWRDESPQAFHTIDDEALRRIVTERARSHRRKMLWRDVSEIGMDAFVVVLLIGTGLWSFVTHGGTINEGIVPLLVTATGYAFVASFRWISRQRQKRWEEKFDDSIHGNLQKLVARADYQIRLKSRFAWWYMLPIIPGFMMISSASTDGAPLVAKWVFGALMCLIFWFMDWGNKRQIRAELVPQKKELESLLAGLENGGKSAEIRLASSPARTVPLSRRIFGLALAAVIFGLGVWLFFAILHPIEEPRAPEFDDVSAYTASDTAQIDAWLQQQFDRSEFPSLSVAVVRNGEVVYQRALGFEDTWTRRKATQETAYHVASVTKAFTASLAMLLHARGVIDLDQPVVKYLPENVAISTRRELGAQITLRQLASHTSGLPRSVLGQVQSVEGRHELEPQRLYDQLEKVSLESDPGTSYLYSNLGFGLLGHALELAAKKPLNQLLQELICAPLHLEHTAYHVDEKLPVATGYTTPPQLPETHSYRQRLAGSGGLVTSVGDLAKFLAAQMKPGLFTSEMLEQLHAKTKLKNGSSIGDALGWSIDTANPAGLILHKNGGRGNASAWIGFAPEHGVGVAVITNVGSPEVDSIGRWLLERSLPGGRKLVTKDGYAKVAPFTGVRWENDRPIVCVSDRWLPLASINGLPMNRIMEFAGKEFGTLARKRFAEDLPELLSKMGHPPDWEVTLGLEMEKGQIEFLRVKMIEHNRQLVRDRNRE